MQSKSSYALIAIGLCTRSLYNSFPDEPARVAKRHLKMIKRGLNDLDFRVSLSALIELESIESELAALGDDDLLGEETAQNISRFMLHFEKVLHAEASTKRVYLVSRRKYDNEVLLSEPSRLLKAGDYQKLNTIAKSDLASAARCLALAEATASAFHILRATEDTLRSYYRHKIKRSRLPKPMWGPMTSALRSKQRNKPSDTLLNSLDLVRTSYRNPTQHPDATYDIDGAEDLFGVCLDLIGKMARELPERPIGDLSAGN